METRWMFHRMQMPLGGVPHFDMLHPARRLWKARADAADGGRLPAVDARAHAVRRARASAMCRDSRFPAATSSSCAPAIRGRSSRCSSTTASTSCRWPRSWRAAVQLAREGHASCRDAREALALGKVFERAGLIERAEACYRCGRDVGSTSRCEGKRCIGWACGCAAIGDSPRRPRVWRDVLRADRAAARPRDALGELRQFADRGARHSSRAPRARPGERAGAGALRAARRPTPSSRDGIAPPARAARSKARQKKDAQLFTS